MENVIIKMDNILKNKRIETKLEIQSYLDKLKYALESSSTKFNLQTDRKVDLQRELKFTNRYTISRLFPDEDVIKVLKRELSLLKVEEYIETVKDDRYPGRSEMRVFGRQYSGDDVYIKLRVELVNLSHAYGGSYILVMSFHFSEWNFKNRDFPYK